MREPHVSDLDLHPADGWFHAQCLCGWTQGPFPDTETMVDALMEHAALAANPAPAGLTAFVLGEDAAMTTVDGTFREMFLKGATVYIAARLEASVQGVGGCYECELYRGTDKAPPPHDHPDGMSL